MGGFHGFETEHWEQSADLQIGTWQAHLLRANQEIGVPAHDKLSLLRWMLKCRQDHLRVPTSGNNSSVESVLVCLIN